MTMGEVLTARLDDDDLQFMEEERQLKELATSSPATTSNESSRQNFSDDYDDIFEGLGEITTRTEEQSSPSTSFDQWDILDGMDLPPKIVEKRKNDRDQPAGRGEAEQEPADPQDCHDFYGEIKWCDEIIQKFEAQLAAEEENEVEKSLMETQEEAKRLVAEARMDKEQEKLMKNEDKLKRRALSQANKDKPLFCCFICNKAFLSEEVVQKHVNETHLRLDARYPFKCKHCSMRYAHTSNLYRHQATHKEQPYKCPQCPYQFKQQTSLDIHLSRDHKVIEVVEDEEDFHCKICKNSFASEPELKRHEYYCKNKEEIAQRRKEQKEKEKQAIGEVMVTSPAMSVNSAGSSMSTGSGAGRPTKDKSCPYCLDVFASMQSRNRHIGRKHPEKKDDQETKNVQYFKVDSPDLPYACLQCGKRFASSASLQTHKKRIHEKILNHVCEKCGKGYPLGSELRKHLRRVHQMTELEAQDITAF